MVGPGCADIALNCGNPKKCMVGEKKNPDFYKN